MSNDIANLPDRPDSNYMSWRSGQMTLDHAMIVVKSLSLELIRAHAVHEIETPPLYFWAGYNGEELCLVGAIRPRKRDDNGRHAAAEREEVLRIDPEHLNKIHKYEPLKEYLQAVMASKENNSAEQGANE